MPSKRDIILAIQRNILKVQDPKLARPQHPIALYENYAIEVGNIVANQGKRDIDIVMSYVRRVQDSRADDLFRQLKRLLRAGLLEEALLILPAARDAANAIGGVQGAQLQTALGAIILPRLDEPLNAAVDAFQKQSLKYIRKGRRKAVGEFLAIAQAHFRKKSSASDLEAALSRRLQISADHAKLVARDQAGSYFSTVAKVRHRAIGVTEYIWRTSNDERVRDAHVDREGQKYSYNDPPSDGNPGEPVLCRCTASPVFA